MLAAMLFTTLGAECLSLHHTKIKQLDTKHQEDIIAQLNLMYVPRALLLRILLVGFGSPFQPLVTTLEHITKSPFAFLPKLIGIAIIKVESKLGSA